MNDILAPLNVTIINDYYDDDDVILYYMNNNNNNLNSSIELQFEVDKSLSSTYSFYEQFYFD